MPWSTSLTPTACPARDRLRLIFSLYRHRRPQLGDHDSAIVEFAILILDTRAVEFMVSESRIARQDGVRKQGLSCRRRGSEPILQAPGTSTCNQTRSFLILFLNRNGTRVRCASASQRNGETNRELSGFPVLAMEECRITVGLAGVSGSTRLRTLRGSRHSGCLGA